MRTPRMIDVCGHAVCVATEQVETIRRLATATPSDRRARAEVAGAPFAKLADEFYLSSFST